MNHLLDQLRLLKSESVLIAYNNKIVPIDYVEGKDRQFKIGAMRIQDNLCTGGYTDTIGYLKTKDGKIFVVERGKKLAKELKEERP